jgi:hypothetical protein
MVTMLSGVILNHAMESKLASSSFFISAAFSNLYPRGVAETAMVRPVAAKDPLKNSLRVIDAFMITYPPFP